MRGKSLGSMGLAVVAAVVMGGPGFSQEPGEKYALLVGVSTYARTSELRKLQYPERDMEDLAAVLRDAGYRPENVVLMTQTAGATPGNTRFLPIAANIRTELKALLRDRIKADSVLVAFAGHGIQFRGSDAAYFCPADARPNDKNTLISLNEVYQTLAGCEAQLKLLMSDACRNDPVATVSRRATVDVASVTRPQSVKPPGGVAALFSCSEGELAFENDALKHGVFFHFIIQGLRGDADFNDDKEIALQELSLFSTRRVLDFVRAEYDGLRQMPVLKGEVGGLPVLASLDRARIKLPDRPAPPSTPSPGETRPKTIINSIGMTLTLIPAGTFLMGSPEDDKDADDFEKSQHPVRITRPFYLGVHEVTQAQYQALMVKNPSAFSAIGSAKDKVAGQSTEQFPVEQVSWLDAVTYCNRLSEKERLKPFYEIDARSARVADWKGPGYRLPTEAEWEYACRAGRGTRFSFGDDPAGLGDHSWYSGNSDGQPHPVGQKRGNAFELFDMQGNVWEWCWDWHGAYQGGPPVADPTGPTAGSSRVVRGGSWYFGAGICRAAYRRGIMPTNARLSMGLRLARVPSSR
jgi:formylglycine-generating enzyme required for sulfatase activity